MLCQKIKLEIKKYKQNNTYECEAHVLIASKIDFCT